MQTAYLYIRVSTDEQATKGYSLSVQEEKLRQFCIAGNIQALKTIEENYSAMTFDRPAWTKLMADLNSHKSKRPDFILFTRWDRFSRNVADAYCVIRLLGNLGIEPQAIDQPLDLTIPENKLMLAIYIAIAEVENDRRILNVKQSIIKARLEGRWTSHAPLGWTSQSLDKKHRSIVPKEPQASLIKEAFKLIALEKQRSVQSVFEQMVACGLKCSSSHFWRILRNRVYCGMVKVPAHDGYKAYWIKGLHEALISEDLFRQVQQRLNRNKKSNVIISNPHEKLFLRGFVYCPKCGNRLTGSGSKGRRARYYYYHCMPPCHFRIRADVVNQLFCKELEKLSINVLYLELYKEILKQTRKELFAEEIITQKTLCNTIDSSVDRILNARKLAEAGELTVDEYKAIKSKQEQEISTIGLRLQRSAFLTKRNKRNLNKAVSWLSGLSDFLPFADAATQANLVSLIFGNNETILTEHVHYSDSFGFAMQSIFDLKVTNFNTCIHHYQVSIADEKFSKKVFQKVMEIEYQKGNGITKSQGQEITGFLMDLASIITRKFC